MCSLQTPRMTMNFEPEGWSVGAAFVNQPADLSRNRKDD